MIVGTTGMGGDMGNMDIMGVGVGIMVVEGDTRLLLWRIVGGRRRMMLRWGFVRGVQRLVVVVGAQLCDLRGFDSSRSLVFGDVGKAYE